MQASLRRKGEQVDLSLVPRPPFEAFTAVMQLFLTAAKKRCEGRPGYEAK